MNINWVKIFGDTSWDGKTLKYKPALLSALTPPPIARPQISMAIAKSNIFFENGEIHFVISLVNPLSGCQIIFNQGLIPTIQVGLNYNGYPYGIGLYQNNAWENLSVSGIGAILTEARDYDIRVVVKGSFITLFVDDVQTCSALSLVEKSQIAFYFTGDSEVNVSNITIKKYAPKAFIIMQYTEEYNELFKEVIQPVCEEHGLEAIRADDVITQNQIIQDIIYSIKESAVIVADITPDNPNVYYEVGFSHGINKPTILLCETNRERLPFDLSGFRTIFYKNKIAGKSKIEKTLRKHLKAIGF